MPVCAVRHCPSRSGKRKLENIKLFSFPKDAELQQQWLGACQRQDVDIKLSAAAVCEIHFTSDCFVDKMTQPRTANVQPRMMRRLKIGSVPTLQLDLCNNKGALSESLPASASDRHNKTASSRTKSCFTGIPSYAELLICAKEKAAENANVDLRKSPLKNVDIQGPDENNEEKQDFDTSPTEFCDVHEETCFGSSEVENAPNENEELSRLKQLNERLTKQISELQAENKKIKEEREFQENMEIELNLNLLMEIRAKDEQIQGMKKNEENLLNKILDLETEKNRAVKRCLEMEKDVQNNGKQAVKKILSKVFTPGQIKVLMSDNRSRIRWSSKDIASALALRAKSGPAYKYLREVLHIPLPCETVLRD